MSERQAHTSAVLIAVSLGILLAMPCHRLWAQTVTVSGDPGMLTVGSAPPGSPLDPASDASTTYTVTTTAAGQRIVARLDTPLPSGVTLTVSLTPPSGAANEGEITLSTVDQTVVGSIPAAGTYSGLAITYRLAAVTAAGPVPTTVRSVVLTVVPGS